MIVNLIRFKVNFLSRVAKVIGSVERLLGSTTLCPINGVALALKSVPVIDGLLAATALVNDLTLVTLNDRDVAGLSATVLNPFRAPKSPSIVASAVCG